MLLLIEYYKTFSKKGDIEVTKSILKWTEKYVENTDMYLSFLNEKTEDSINHIKCSDLFQEYSNWFRINNPSEKIGNIKDFNQGIKKFKKIEKIRFGNNSLLGIKNLKIIDDFE